VADKQPINWSMWGAIASLFLLPAIAIGLQLKRFRYGLDSSEGSVTAASLEKGGAHPRNVTITDGVVDTDHSVTWVLLEDGSEKDRYYLYPMRSKSGGKHDKGKHEKGGGAVKILLTSHDQGISEEAQIKGIVRDLDGDGVGSDVIKKFDEEGVEIDTKAVMVEVGASTQNELLGVLFYVGLAFVAPIAAIVGMIAFKRKEKGDANREVKIKQLRANLPPDLAALEDALGREMMSFAQITHDDSFYVYSFTAVGPFKVTLHLDDQDRDAPPEMFALVQRIHECYRGHGIKVEGVNYFMEKRGEPEAWRLRGTAR
jgi:hypothetical protein